MFSFLFEKIYFILTGAFRSGHTNKAWHGPATPTDLQPLDGYQIHLTLSRSTWTPAGVAGVRRSHTAYPACRIHVIAITLALEERNQYKRKKR
jgi:hypothetical protein